jgi:hypothetical protein
MRCALPSRMSCATPARSKLDRTGDCGCSCSCAQSKTARVLTSVCVVGQTSGQPCAGALWEWVIVAGQPTHLLAVGCSIANHRRRCCCCCGRRYCCCCRRQLRRLCALPLHPTLTVPRGVSVDVGEAPKEAAGSCAAILVAATATPQNKLLCGCWGPLARTSSWRQLHPFSSLA